MATRQSRVEARRAVVCWHHSDLQRLKNCLENNYCDLYAPGPQCSRWWNKLELRVGDFVRFSVKGNVVAYGRILSEPYDLVSRKSLPPLSKSWPGAVDIGQIEWRTGGNCASPLVEVATAYEQRAYCGKVRRSEDSHRLVENITNEGRSKAQSRKPIHARQLSPRWPLCHSRLPARVRMEALGHPRVDAINFSRLLYRQPFTMEGKARELCSAKYTNMDLALPTA